MPGPGVLRVEQLAAQQAQRRLVVEVDGVERVGDDLAQPHEPALHVLDEEEIRRPEQQGAAAGAHRGHCRKAASGLRRVDRRPAGRALVPEVLFR